MCSVLNQPAAEVQDFRDMDMRRQLFRGAGGVYHCRGLLDRSAGIGHPAAGPRLDGCAAEPGGKGGCHGVHFAGTICGIGRSHRGGDVDGDTGPQGIQAVQGGGDGGNGSFRGVIGLPAALTATASNVPSSRR